MDPVFLQLLGFGFFAGIANILGGLILFPRKLQGRYKKVLRYFLAIGAGFMLAVTFFEIVPKTIILWQKSHSDSVENLSIPMFLLLTGYLLTQFFEHTIAPHFHLGEEVHSDEIIRSTSAYAGISGLFVHTFFDGVSIAAASHIDARVGFLVFVAVFLHKFPEGFTVGSMILAAGKGRRQVMIASSLIGLTTILGVMIFYLIGLKAEFLVIYALPIASGVTLYVAASDLIPEVNHHGGSRPLVALSVFAGVGLFFLIRLFVHSLIEH